MLILILIDIQYPRKAALSFKKGLNHQNHSSSGFRPSKKILLVKFPIPSTPYQYLENPDAGVDLPSELVSYYIWVELPKTDTDRTHKNDANSLSCDMVNPSFQTSA